MSDDREPAPNEGVEPVARVVDPAMSAKARAELLRKIWRQRSDGTASAVAGCSLFLFIPSSVTTLILHFVTGLSWWWLIASTLLLIISITVGVRYTASLDDRDHSHFVEASELDEPSRGLLYRVQEAIRSVLSSDVYANNSFDNAVEESTLRRHEWEMAIALRKITTLRAEQEASKEGDPPGPMTATVLDTQQHALTLAVNATESRIRALEQYAAKIKEADAAERDWKAALKASGRNDEYLALIAATVADEHAIAEIEGLTEQVAAAVQVFRENLYQASLAAQALILPASLQN